MVAHASTPLPELAPDDRALVLRFIDSGADLAAMAESFIQSPLPQASGWTILDLYRWSLSETIAPWLAFHIAQIDQSLRAKVIRLLSDVARDATDASEKRRAATTILRALRTPNAAARNPRESGAPRTEAPLSIVETVDVATNAQFSPLDTFSGQHLGSSEGHPETLPEFPTEPPPDLQPDDQSQPTPEPASDFEPVVLTSTPDLDRVRASFFAAAPDHIDAAAYASHPHPEVHPVHAACGMVAAMQRIGRDPSSHHTLFNHSGIADRSPESFQAFCARLDEVYQSAHVSGLCDVTSHHQTGDHTYECTLVVQTERGNRPRIHISLYRPTQGPLARCWLVDYFADSS